MLQGGDPWDCLYCRKKNQIGRGHYRGSDPTVELARGGVEWFESLKNKASSNIESAVVLEQQCSYN